MTKYREILRLKSLGLSQQSIADSCNVSKKTVNRVLKRAKELNISWPLDKSDTDAVLAEMFFPSTKQVRSNKRIPKAHAESHAYPVGIHSVPNAYGYADGRNTESAYHIFPPFY